MVAELEGSHATIKKDGFCGLSSLVCNDWMDRQPFTQIVWEWYKVCGREKTVVLVQSRKMRTLGCPSGKIINDIWEVEWSLGVKHVKAHRTEKEKQPMTQTQRFMMEVNERRMCCQEEGAIFDGGVMAEIRAQQTQAKDKIIVCCFFEGSWIMWRHGETVMKLCFTLLDKCQFITRRRDVHKSNVQMCNGGGTKCRCMKCGTRSRYQQILGRCRGFKWMGLEVNPKLNKWGKKQLGRARFATNR